MNKKDKKLLKEAIKILGMYDRNCKISMGMAMSNCKKFLKENFDLEEKK
tara:strand:+ start:455 stop:601 length:147 start_codon:yes stop_codon:yes gene_type:complete